MTRDPDAMRRRMGRRMGWVCCLSVGPTTYLHSYNNLLSLIDKKHSEGVGEPEPYANDQAPYKVIIQIVMTF